MYRLVCGDVMPECAARFEGTDRARLIAEVTQHAARAHGIVGAPIEITMALECRISVHDRPHAA